MNDGPGIRLDSARDDLKQGGFPAPLGPIRPIRARSLMAQFEIAEQISRPAKLTVMWFRLNDVHGRSLTMQESKTALGGAPEPFKD